MIPRITENTIRYLVETNLMNHNLKNKGWSFKLLTTSKRQHGYCDYTNKVIAISKYYIGTEFFNELRDTVLHEIAHALTPGEHHSKKWKNICLRLRIKPERVTYTILIERKWLILCEQCGIIGESHRKLKTKNYCNKCKNDVFYIEK